MRRIYIIFILFYHISFVYGQSIIRNASIPKYEVRAVWLTTIGGIDWPHSYSQSPRSAEKQKQELRNILDRLQKAHINTVLLQTRIRGTLIYPSKYEPWDGCLSGFPGKSPGYDALQFAIDECHKRGMELHAWVVTMPVGKWNGLGCKQLRKKFPQLIKKIDDDGYMSPEMSQTGNYLAQICQEIAHNYDVDGIHLDYIRYPETWKVRVSKSQARSYISSIVEKISHAVKAEKPWIKMSCAPIGKFDNLSRYDSYGWNAYNKGAQDAQEWLKEGLMDELFPMMYFRGNQFFPFAIDWQENSHGKIIAPGLGIYFLDPKEGKWNINEVTSELYHLRNIGQGHAFFRNKFLLDNIQGIYDFTANDFNLYPALVPPMTWISSKQPMAPRHIATKEENGRTIIEWENNTSYSDGTPMSDAYIYNNVYASKNYPVNTNDARNLLVVKHKGNKIELDTSDNSNWHYAVTTTDQYGNESKGCQPQYSDCKQTFGLYGAAKILKIANDNLILPKEIDNDDAKYYIIESLQQQTIWITDNKSPINIKKIKPGIYLLKYVNNKKIEHTIGRFTKNINNFLKKSSEKIWWNKKKAVPLHSQFRNEAFKKCTLSSVGRATDS